MTKDQWWSVFRGAILAGVGAAVAVLTDAASKGALGPWSPVVGAIASVVVNIIRKQLEAK